MLYAAKDVSRRYTVFPAYFLRRTILRFLCLPCFNKLSLQNLLKYDWWHGHGRAFFRASATSLPIPTWSVSRGTLNNTHRRRSLTISFIILFSSFLAASVWFFSFGVFHVKNNEYSSLYTETGAAVLFMCYENTFSVLFSSRHISAKQQQPFPLHCPYPYSPSPVLNTKVIFTPLLG